MRLIMLFALIHALCACAPILQQGANERVSSETIAAPQVLPITVQNAHARLQDSKTAWRIIDFRTPEEYATGHLKGAQLINFFDDDFRAQVASLEKDMPTLIYCRSGNRSGQAASVMQELGFRNVFDLQGGILAWQAAGFELEN